MTSRHPRQRLISLRSMLGASAAVVATAALGTQAAFAQNPSDASAACAKLATFSNFPVVPNARGSTSANGVALPDHCQVQGIINKRVGTDGSPYSDRFEVRLPTPFEWNGRFMFQGGGGTEGAVPPAMGYAAWHSVADALSPTLAHGWV